MVLVDQPTEDLAPLRNLASRWSWVWDRPADIVRTTKTEPAMRSMRVVMRGILTQHVRQVPSTQDQHVIEHLPSHASDQSLDVTVGLRSPVGGEHDLDTLSGEDGIEAAAELRVAVAKQEAHAGLGVVVQIHHQVARLLGHPGPVRVGTHPDPEDPAVWMCMNTSTNKVLRNTVSTVKKSQGTMPFGLRGEELMPGRTVPARGRPKASATKDRTDRRGGDDDPTPWSSPLIRTHPQRGFSLAMRRISALVSESMGGRCLGSAGRRSS